MADRVDYFKGIMGYFPTGVTVVSTRSEDGTVYGVTVSSFTSVSLDPQLVSICLDNTRGGLSHFTSNSLFSINFLREDQQDVSDHFATPGTDRSLESGLYNDHSDRTPELRDKLAVITCRLSHRYPAGDHTILIGEVVSARIIDTNAKPLIYFRGRYLREE